MNCFKITRIKYIKSVMTTQKERVETLSFRSDHCYFNTNKQILLTEHFHSQLHYERINVFKESSP